MNIKFESIINVIAIYIYTYIYMIVKDAAAVGRKGREGREKLLKFT